MVLNSLFTETLYIDFPHCRFGAVSRSYLRCCLLGCSPYFAPRKTHNSQVVHLFLVDMVKREISVYFNYTINWINCNYFVLLYLYLDQLYYLNSEIFPNHNITSSQTIDDNLSL